MRIAIPLLLLLAACGGPDHQVTLNGFDRGNHTMKFEFKLFRQKYPDGSRGYRLESLQAQGTGAAPQRRIHRVAQLDSNFFLLSSRSERQDAQTTVVIESSYRPGLLVLTTRVGDGQPEAREIVLDKPVFIELHPWMYGRQLREPGTETTYSVIDEQNGALRPVTVRYSGPTRLLRAGAEIPVRHFQIQVVPDQWDDYYLDPETLAIEKIQFGMIQFLPPGVTP
jgi:hypothetical protein